MSSSVTHVERDRKVSAASKISSYTSQTRTESEKERRAREATVERERAVVERERVAVERDRAERERVVAERERLERERVEREREKAERAERERFERERFERERENAERERIERENAERERLAWEQAERERQREQAEREQTERERTAAVAAPTKGKKGKGTKNLNTNKLNSPVDLADTTVGKSPGQLGQALTSVWGSQSKAATPAASPFPSSARSVGPESLKLAPRELEPTTPAVAGAPTSFFSDLITEKTQESLVVSSGLFLDVSQTEEVKLEDTPAGQTPANTDPPTHFVSETSAEFNATTEAVESTFERIEESETRGMFESVEVSETATTTAANTTSVFGFSTNDTSGAQGDTTQTSDEWGMSSWGATSFKETTESVTAATKSLGFGFGSGSGSGSLGMNFSMPGKGALSNTWNGMSSIFGGGTNNEIELDPILGPAGEGGGEGGGETPFSTEEPPSANAIEGAAEGANAVELETVPIIVPAPLDGALEAPLESAPPAGQTQDEFPPTTEPSATENPTDAPGEEEQDDGFATTKKGKKKGGAGGKKKKGR